MVIAIPQTGDRRFRAVRPWTLLSVCIAVGAVCKQLAVNALGGDRHSVAAVLEVLVFSVAAAATLQVLRNGSRLHFQVVIALQLFATSIWTLLAVLGPSEAPWSDRLVALGSDIGFSLLIWVPFVVTANEVLAVRNVVAILASGLALLGLAQFVLPTEFMPQLLSPDTTVYLSATAIGTVRANGLIGNPIEFGALMTTFSLVAYGLLMVRPTLRTVGVLALFLVGVAVSGSRAAWLAAGIFLVAITPARRLPYLLVPVSVLWIATALLLPSGYWTAYFEHPRVYLESDGLRIWTMQAAMEQVSFAPMYGLGVGSQLGFTATKLVTDGYWFSLLLEGGFVGAACTGVAIIAAATLVARRSLPTMRVSLQSLRLIGAHRRAALAILGILAFEGFINSFNTNQSVAILFYLSLGYCLRMSSADGYDESPPPARPSQ